MLILIIIIIKIIIIIIVVIIIVIIIIIVIKYLKRLPVVRPDTVEMSAWGVAALAGIQVPEH